MSEYSQEEIDTAENKRPTLLTVLVVLSLMVIGNGLLSNIAGLYLGPLSAEEIQKLTDPYMPQVNQFYELGQPYWGDTMLKILNLVKFTNANFIMDRMINITAYGIGLFGVLNMLRGIKLGFHMYIIYNMIALFSIYASAPLSEIPGFYFGFYGVISLLFIYLYSKNLHWMTK